MSYLDAIAKHLAAGGFGVFEPVDGTAPTIFVGLAPDDLITGDAVISLLERPGPVDETFTAEWGRPNVDIMVRGVPYDPTGPEDKAWAVWTYLNQVANETVQGVDFVRISPNLTPGFLQTDARNRDNWNLDYGVWLG